jgi:hypothetical protein
MAGTSDLGEWVTREVEQGRLILSAFKLFSLGQVGLADTLDEWLYDTVSSVY